MNLNTSEKRSFVDSNFIKHSCCHLRSFFSFVKSETLSDSTFHLVWHFWFGFSVERVFRAPILALTCHKSFLEFVYGLIYWPYTSRWETKEAFKVYPLPYLPSNSHPLVINCLCLSVFHSSASSTSWNCCWPGHSTTEKIFSPSISPAAHICLLYKCHYSLNWFVDAVQELRRKEEAAARGFFFFSYVCPIITYVLLQSLELNMGLFLFYDFVDI